MMKPMITTTLFVATALLSAAAVATPECTQAPKDKWMSEAAMKQQIIDHGYTIKVSGNCSEIHGEDRAGKKVAPS